jgi:hypothetical protein
MAGGSFYVLFVQPGSGAAPCTHLFISRDGTALPDCAATSVKE